MYIEEKLVVFFPLGKMRQCTVCCENLREMRGLLTVWHAWKDEPKNKKIQSERVELILNWKN